MMKTENLRYLFIAIVSLVLARPMVMATGGSIVAAPAAVNSFKVELTVLEATYSDDFGTDVVNVLPADFNSGAYTYHRTSNVSVATLIYENIPDGSNSYSGTYTLTFTSSDGGTFTDDYTGSYTGHNAGTFTVLGADVPAPPVAKGKTVNVSEDKNKGFVLKGVGNDIGAKELKFKITQKPEVGELVTNKLPKVIYKPEPGFTGTVKFKFIVKEGKTQSKPATVTLKVN